MLHAIAALECGSFVGETHEISPSVSVQPATKTPLYSKANVVAVTNRSILRIRIQAILSNVFAQLVGANTVLLGKSALVARR